MRPFNDRWTWMPLLALAGAAILAAASLVAALVERL